MVIYRKKFFLFLIVIAFAQTSLAQYQSAPVWMFGYNAGLDFNNPANPVPISSSVYTHSAVTATQCDASGNVLFYANGLKIFDRNGNAMGQNPVWSFYTSSWSLQSLIIPDPGDMNRYYVVNIIPSQGNPPFGPSGIGQLFYSIVDMSLNGGLGGVVPGQNYTLVDKNVGSYMYAVPDDQCNYWLITQTGMVHTFTFKVFKISAAGFDTIPVSSNQGFLASAIPAFPYGIDNRNGNMIYSYTRDKLFVSYNAGDLYAFDFNRSTGKVSNPQLLGWNYAPTTAISASTPGICLSPDESMLYSCGYTMGSNFELRQYPIIASGANVSLGTPTIIFNVFGGYYTAMQQQTGYVWNETNLQMGPDNKIYVAFTIGQNFLGRIEQPNVAGTGCNFIPSAISLLPNTYTTNALPSPQLKRLSSQIIPGQKSDTTICFLDELMLKAPDTSYIQYTWNNGASGKETSVSETGSYIVTSSSGNCQSRRDTFDVAFVDFNVFAGKDTAICDPILLQATTNATSPINYLWSTGAETNTITAGTGTYWVRINKEGCEKADTVTIDSGKLQPPFEGDALLCSGSSFVLSAYTPDAIYTWQDGSTLPEYVVTHSGAYSVNITKGFCTTTATKNVYEEVCNCFVTVPSAFTPNNDGRNETIHAIFPEGCKIDYFQLNIYNRWGQLVFYTTNLYDHWNGLFNGAPAEVGTYMYYMEYAMQKGVKKQVKGDVTLIR